ncbi:MAG: hypothetical protein A3B99_03500 [Candidatus Yanofskybacteria bacterium RIFCSPHIGHO2_02_FULL_44_12b]|uniref:Uncharacterized protein n=2 Tax=Candidatus Yanofskyibacteriota TaxID=1752733 RepID=A0A1F8GJM4_9BACT|nr:MAG: hypothetical protein UW79_C0031G0014 [Candidatus Yanofskybacteria bacterium GW2011_GWA2_44_9]OGN04221.1 MAG: hypothetical protein A2659_04030 [Candidatus Yanofskybacteria bacterium RIFCSPHIGHO2_01_FULL_44_24]OGN13923.1 MAG: hypothetical protein A3B99_03500 [Candidatus Yanofskybacteria bacterium RIFCSPHIGHO2_02_FULL_44_12b]OGN25607.1 MAG: hypothetical protein A2925_01780 [Candidatus Yanofskybacteria bacterium RIFCSPLOWO2_01_FULL_44_22]
MPVESPTIEKESSSEKTERKVELKEIAELEEPIKKIIEKILPRIESGDYGLIVGDDSSGRIPARILEGFIKRICEANGL